MSQTTAINAVGVWGRPRLLATLLAAGVAGVLCIIGLGMAIFYGIAGPRAAAPARVTAAAAAVTGSGPAYRDQIAAQPMLQAAPDDARAGVPAALAGPVIAIPASTGTGPVQVPSGFPHTSEGAIGQLAAIEQAVLQGMNIAAANAVHAAWALPGAPEAPLWPLTQNVQAFLAAAQIPSPLGPTAAVVVTPVGAQVKGLDGPDWVLACVLVQVRATIAQDAQMAYGYCEPMTWHQGRWMIAPGDPAAPAPCTWPGTDLSIKAGWRTWAEQP